MKCKKCNSEIVLINSNEILGHWEYVYVCSDENCSHITILDDKYNEIEWDEE